MLGAEWQQPRVAHPCLPLRPAVGLEHRLTPPENLDQRLQWEALDALSRVGSFLRPLRLDIVLPSVPWTFPGGCEVTSQASQCRRTPSMHPGVLPRDGAPGPTWRTVSSGVRAADGNSDHTPSDECVEVSFPRWPKKVALEGKLSVSEGLLPSSSGEPASRAVHAL